MNIIAVSGNLCQENEIKYTKNNKAVLTNTLAVKKENKDAEGKYGADFIEVVMFEKKAEFIKNYTSKGDKIEVVGKLRVDSWKDDSGNYHSRTYIVADKVEIMSAKEKTKESTITVDIDDDKYELPF